MYHLDAGETYDTGHGPDCATCSTYAALEEQPIE